MNPQDSNPEREEYERRKRQLVEAANAKRSAAMKGNQNARKHKEKNSAGTKRVRTVSTHPLYQLLAELTGTNRGTVQRMRYLQKHADQSVMDKILRGELSSYHAVQAVQLKRYIEGKYNASR